MSKFHLGVLAGMVLGAYITAFIFGIVRIYRKDRLKKKESSPCSKKDKTKR